MFHFRQRKWYPSCVTGTQCPVLLVNSCTFVVSVSQFALKYKRTATRQIINNSASSGNIILLLILIHTTEIKASNFAGITCQHPVLYLQSNRLKITIPQGIMFDAHPHSLCHNKHKYKHGDQGTGDQQTGCIYIYFSLLWFLSAANQMPRASVKTNCINASAHL